jgi:hypothetical protein
MAGLLLTLGLGVVRKTVADRRLHVSLRGGFVAFTRSAVAIRGHRRRG